MTGTRKRAQTYMELELTCPRCLTSFRCTETSDCHRLELCPERLGRNIKKKLCMQ